MIAQINLYVKIYLNKKNFFIFAVLSTLTRPACPGGQIPLPPLFDLTPRRSRDGDSIPGQTAAADHSRENVGQSLNLHPGRLKRQPRSSSEKSEKIFKKGVDSSDISDIIKTVQK